MNLDSIKTYLHRFPVYEKLANYIRRRTIRKNPYKEIERCYKIVWGGVKPDLDNPKNLIEKIYWMELYADLSLWSVCEDKYGMRAYIEEKGLGQYLPKLYGHWDNANDFNIDTIPQSFVLKSNNGCGTVMIVKDKTTLNLSETKKILNRWLKIPYGYSNAALHYLAIKPCIICEEILKNDTVYTHISPHSLVDFKVWCINGKPRSILVFYERRSPYCKIGLFNTKWEQMTDKIRFMEHYKYDPNIAISKPECLEEMLNVAGKLSEGFPQMRVDFYVVDGKPVIGELTLATGYGYLHKEYYEELGREIDLSKVKLAKIPNYKTV